MPYFPPPGVPDPYTPPDGTWNLVGDLQIPNTKGYYGLDAGAVARLLAGYSGNDTFFGSGTPGVLYIGTGNAQIARIETIEGVQVTCRLREGVNADLASAGTITFGLDGNSCDVTGTTTVDKISESNWDEGSSIQAFFTAALTIRHNNNGSGGAGAIMLAGSINVLTVASCRFVFQLRGDPADSNALKWWEMSRTYV